jgi:hypothetical protein
MNPAPTQARPAPNPRAGAARRSPAPFCGFHPDDHAGIASGLRPSVGITCQPRGTVARGNAGWSCGPSNGSRVDGDHCASGTVPGWCHRVNVGEVPKWRRLRSRAVRKQPVGSVWTALARPGVGGFPRLQFENRALPARARRHAATCTADRLWCVLVSMFLGGDTDFWRNDTVPQAKPSRPWNRRCGSIANQPVERQWLELEFRAVKTRRWNC